MRNRSLILAVAALAVLAFGLQACKTGTPVAPGAGERGGGGGADVTFPPSTTAGTMLLNNQIRVESVKEPTGAGDKAVFVLKNMAPTDLEFLTGGILFYFDPQPESVALLASHGTLQAFDIVKGGTKTLEAEYKHPGPLGSLELRIERRETAPGVTYQAGALECTDVLTDMPGMSERLAFKVKNVTSSGLDSVQYRVVLLDRASGDKLQESRWVPVPGDNFAPGEEKTLVPKFRRKFTGYPVAVLLIQQLG